MTHILRIDEMNGNGYTEKQNKINNHLKGEISNMHDKFHTWMSNAIECKYNGKNYPYICFVSEEFMDEASQAEVNRFGYITDAHILKDVARRGGHVQAWVWDTEETYFTLNDMVMSCLKRINDIRCYLLIIVKDRNEYMDFMNRMGSHAVAIRSRSLTCVTPDIPDDVVFQE